MRAAVRANRRVLLGSGLALGAALSYGGSQVIVKEVVSEYAPPLVAAAFALLFGTLFLLAIAFRDLPNVSKVPRRDLRFVILAGLTAGGGIIALYFALSRAPVVMVSPIASIHPLVALVLAHLFLQRLERITVRVVSGTFLVVGGVVLVVLGNNL